MAFWSTDRASPIQVSSQVDLVYPVRLVEWN